MAFKDLQEHLEETFAINHHERIVEGMIRVKSYRSAQAREAYIFASSPSQVKRRREIDRRWRERMRTECPDVYRAMRRAVEDRRRLRVRLEATGSIKKSKPGPKPSEDRNAKRRARQQARRDAARGGPKTTQSWRLSAEQRDWARTNGLTLTETAKQLGVSTQAVASLRKKGK